jgi:hypothetical protein
MNKKIRTYEDLVSHREQLELLLEAQQELVKEDFRQVKHEAGKSIASIGKIFTRDTSNFLLMSGANRIIDGVVKNFLLSRAGWFMRLAVPFLLKNFSSHYIADNKDKWYRKLFSWIGK